VRDRARRRGQALEAVGENALDDARENERIAGERPIRDSNRPRFEPVPQNLAERERISVALLVEARGQPVRERGDTGRRADEAFDLVTRKGPQRDALGDRAEPARRTSSNG
jgi:hypothetical protein